MINSTELKNNNINPLVSVCMITYNHEKFIEEAFFGVLQQQIDFNVELVIANDCSNDNTHRILENLIAKNTNKQIEIKYYNQPENLGVMPNFSFALKKCSGKYIALCEGDDYWTDPLKLQKQVRFLNANQSINICFHRAQILKDDALSMHSIPEPFHEKTFKYIELLKNYNFIATASVLLRKPKDFILPEWFSSIPFGDLGLYKLVTQDKQINCLNETMCVYRVHEKGVYSGLSELKAKQNYLSFYKLIFPELSDEERKITLNKIKINSYKLSKLKFPKNRLLQKIYNMYIRLKY